MALLGGATPWYLLKRQQQLAPRLSLAIGTVRPIVTAGIQKRAHTFAEKKKRPKDYSSDSSASERETDKHTEGRIYRAPSGSGKDYYVYYQGKKISFGDSSMKNKNDDDGARANFNARHNCAEKKDKTKAGYWACRVWRKGYRGPDKKG